MIGQQKIKIYEQRVPKFFRTENGCEVVSNDGDLKLILNYERIYLGEMERAHYATTYYIKVDSSWEKTTTSKTYGSMDEFISDIAATQEFSMAVRDYKELIQQKYD